MEGPDRRRQLLSTAAPFAIVFVATAFVAYWQSFTIFQAWDDEGSWLESMRLLLRGASLYGDLYAYHGPFHFELWSLFYGFDPSLPSTDSARFIVIGIWTLTALGAGLAVRHWTGNTWLGIAAQVVWFSGSRDLDSEPGHPLTTVTLLLVLAGCAIAFWMTTNPRRAMTGLGIAAGLLAATKVNVGGLMVIAVIFAGALTLPVMARVRKLVIAGTVLVPFVLMSRDLGTMEWRNFALLVAAGLVAIAAASSAVRPDASEAGGSHGGAELGRFAIGFAAAFAGSVVLTLPFGSNLGDVLHAIFITPFDHPEVNNFPLVVLRGSLTWGILSAGAAFLVRALLIQQRFSARWSGAIRIAGGVVIWSAVGVIPGLSPARSDAILVIPVTYAWIAALPLSRGRSTNIDRFTATSVAAIAVLQALHAYPVAAGQRSPAAMFFVFAGALCFRDGFRELAGERSIAAVLTPRLVGGVLAAIFCVSILVQGLFVTSHDYRTGTALPFDGATHMRLADSTAQPLIHMTAALKQECDAFVGLPGYMSFNAWSGIPPVGDFTMNQWMPLLDDAQQQAIVNELYSHRRPCAIRQLDQLGAYQRGKPLRVSPLVAAVEAMDVVAKFGPYELMVPPARAAAVKRNVAALAQRQPSA